jgi:hypothetical protein
VLTVSTRASDTPWKRIAAIPGRFFATFLANPKFLGVASVSEYDQP